MISPTPTQHYYVQRESKIQGPVPQETLSRLVEQGKILDDDQISESRTGPWERSDAHSFILAVRQRKKQNRRSGIQQCLRLLSSTLSVAISTLYITVLISGTFLVAFVLVGFALRVTVGPVALVEYKELVDFYSFFNMDGHILGIYEK
ncbi:MAG: hypothetical protein ABGW78_06320 [Pirellulales bacterium]